MYCGDVFSRWVDLAYDNPSWLFLMPIYLCPWWPHFFLPFTLSSSLLLFLQCISKLVACSYHCSMLVGGLSAFINFLCIISFIPLLNSSIIICQVYLSGKYIPIMILLSQHLLYKPTFLTTHPCSGDTTIQVFCLLWQGYFYLTQSYMVESYSCQCLNTETSAWDNKSHTTKTLNILLNSISSVQWWHTNQYSLLSQTSSSHLKLWPCGRQTAQYIS